MEHVHLLIIAYLCRVNYNTMRTLLLHAPRDFVDAGIPKRYMLQVITSSTGTPRPSEVREALRRAGFSPRADRYDSAGNWIIKEL